MLRVTNDAGSAEKLRIPVITGPTAVGKTELSLQLAETLGCEIVSADSRQVFRELTIGTAKPTPAQLARAPHHFIDERTLNEPFSAGLFAQEARVRIDAIISRGHVPLVVGGSTLYLSALQFGLSAIPRIPADVRASIENRLEMEGSRALYDELVRVDRQAAETMDHTKTQRLVRALEVFHATGTPLSHFHREPVPNAYAFRTLVLTRDRSDLSDRIERRTDEMLAAGLLDEVRSILEAGYSPSLNALRTIGYKETIAHLTGQIDLDEMRRLIVRNTRRYAKRQLTWFRRYPDYTWLEADAPFSLVHDTFAATMHRS